jgi:hypothetical protein
MNGKEEKMDKFKTPEYLANTGIVHGPYGYIGYFDNNPIEKGKKIKKEKCKNKFFMFDFFFKKSKCACEC